MYSELIRILREAGGKFGKMKEKEVTDDKISLSTKNLMRRREELRGRETLTTRWKVELSEVQKLMKREVRKDIKENSGSTRKLKRELSNGFQIINKLKDKECVMRWRSDNVIRVATEFYSEL